ncbi:hypothetical protein [Salinispora arenicola]|uniref:hypothetical protein n=1 Tax=Salinispora arenicola TaxID=168697 RepID=UPI0027DC7737|nr:hypothetical protein [Salinispora arenicola]
MTAADPGRVGSGESQTPAHTVDLADPATFANRDLTGFPQQLLDEEPIHWNPPTSGRRGFWVVSRYADILDVYRDDVTFTSERGNVLVTLLAGVTRALAGCWRSPTGRVTRSCASCCCGHWGRACSAAVCAAVRANTRQMVREAVTKGECDFASDIASRIPMMTISNLLGGPRRGPCLPAESDEDGAKRRRRKHQRDRGPRRHATRSCSTSKTSWSSGATTPAKMS